MYKRPQVIPRLFTRVLNHEGDLVVNWNDEQFFGPNDIVYSGNLFVRNEHNDIGKELPVFEDPHTKHQYIPSVEAEANLM